MSHENDTQPESAQTISTHGLLHASAGARYLQRAAARRASLNILEMNALELVEVINRSRDAERSFQLFSDDRREASAQAQREIARHVHNFLAAAKTLVDHTRVLMETHYEGTDLLNRYNAWVREKLGKEPVVQFVHGLRNFMLHKGLPPIEMFLKFSRATASSTAFGLETGVTLDLGPIAEWDRLPAGARGYVSNKAGKLDLHIFVEEYLAHVRALHAWLDRELADWHRSDLAEAQKIQAEIGGAAVIPAIATHSEMPEPDNATAWTLADAETIDTSALGLLQKVRPVQVASDKAPRFASRRRVGATITSADTRETPVITIMDPDGSLVVAFLEEDGVSLGLALQDIEDLIDVVHAERWARSTLGREFVKDVFIGWTRSTSANPDFPSFSSTLARRAERSVREYRVTAPVAYLEVETCFDFGMVAIEPISDRSIEALRGIGDEVSPDQNAAVEQLFGKLKDDLVGRAAVVVAVTAEAGLAKQRALRIAQDCVALMRVFSPAANVSGTICPIALLGAEIVPLSKLIIASPTDLQISDSILAPAGTWRIPTSELEALRKRGLQLAASLLSTEGLSPFGLDVRSAMLTFSAGLITSDPFIRLGQALSALERILLRHEIEPREARVARRMAILLRTSPSTAESVGQSVMRGYALLRQASSAPITPYQIDLFAILAAYSQAVLLTALSNVAAFDSKSDFLDAVDDAAYGIG
jgi:hypothetical protein